MKKTIPATQDYSTRRKRKTAINHMVSQLECISAAEAACRDNIPLNLQNSDAYDTADSYIDLLDEAIDILGSVYD